MADLKILLGVDISASVEQVNKDIEVLAGKISKKSLPVMKIGVDSSGLDELSEKIKKISESKLQIDVTPNFVFGGTGAISEDEVANVNAVVISTERLTAAQEQLIKQRLVHTSAIGKETAAEKELLETQARQTNYSDRFLSSIQKQISDIDTYTLKIKNLENSYARIGYEAPDFSGLKNSVAELQNVKLDSSNVTEYAVKVNDLEDAFRKASAEFQGFAKENTAHTAIAQREKEIQSLIYRLEQLYETSKKVQNNPLATSEYTKLMGTLQGGGIDTQAQLINARKEVDRLSNSWKENGLLVQTWGEKIQGAFSKFGGWALVAGISSQVVQSFRQMVTETIKLDSALTELKKVTDETDASYEKFMKRASETAKAIGGTYADVVNSTADFSRLGYSIAQAEDLAKASIVYKAVGDKNLSSHAVMCG